MSAEFASVRYENGLALALTMGRGMQQQVNPQRHSIIMGDHACLQPAGRRHPYLEDERPIYAH
jgi:hypothetical protein